MMEYKSAPLCECVTETLIQYFNDLNGERPTELYSFVIAEIERPLLSVVMHKSDSNQSRAAQMLGINRNTLRKKLKQHGLA